MISTIPNPLKIKTIFEIIVTSDLILQPVSQLARKVKIVEVGPRDGLQNEKVPYLIDRHLVPDLLYPLQINPTEGQGVRGEDIIIMFSVVGLAFLVSAVNEKKNDIFFFYLTPSIKMILLSLTISP